jgi:CDP-6-deoxy-D-xylo-4-hexulose-3-dehydrase
VLGLAQIKKLDSYISIRERNYRRFREIMAPFADRVRVPYREGMSPFCLPFFFNDAADRDRCQKFLREAGVESRPVISGNLLRQPFLKGYGDYRQFPHAEFLHTNGFYIGNNQFVDDQRLGILSDLIRKFFAV